MMSKIQRDYCHLSVHLHGIRMKLVTETSVQIINSKIVQSISNRDNRNKEKKNKEGKQYE